MKKKENTLVNRKYTIHLTKIANTGTKDYLGYFSFESLRFYKMQDLVELYALCATSFDLNSVMSLVGGQGGL